MYKIIEIDGEFRITNSDGSEVGHHIAKAIMGKLRITYPLESYVYLIEERDIFRTIYKIGATSRSPEIRLAEIKDNLNSEYRLIHSLKFDNRQEAFNIERQLHELFSDERLEGEWFRLTSSHISFIQSLVSDKAEMQIQFEQIEFHVAVAEAMNTYKNSRNGEKRADARQYLDALAEIALLQMQRWSDLYDELENS